MSEMSTPSSPDHPYSDGDQPVEQTETSETTTTETPDAWTETTETPALVPPTTEYGATAARFSEPATARFGEPESVPEATTVLEPDPAANVIVRRGIRMRTVVFGLVLMAVAVSVLIGQLTDITVDAGVVVLALMIGCGVLLIAGARRSSTGP
jgi:hypothetical protein